jgi:hypothetical protein
MGGNQLDSSLVKDFKPTAKPVQDPADIRRADIVNTRLGDYQKDPEAAIKKYGIPALQTAWTMANPEEQTRYRDFITLDPVTKAPRFDKLAYTQKKVTPGISPTGGGRPTATPPAPGQTKPGTGQAAAPPASTPQGKATPPKAANEKKGPQTAQAGYIDRVTKPASAPVGRRPVGMPAGEFERQMSVVRPVAVAGTQLFGDISDPNFEALDSFADLADDPGSRERLGTAFRIGLTPLRGASDTGGGLARLIENMGGMTQVMAQYEAGVHSQAIANLTSREQKAYNATMATLSAVPGYRRITGQSAARFAMDALERDVPMIGPNTPSSTMFYDKMNRLAKEPINAADTLNIELFSTRRASGEEVLKYWEKKQQEYSRKAGEAVKPGGAARAEPPGKKISVETTDGHYEFDTQEQADQFKAAAKAAGKIR